MGTNAPEAFRISDLEVVLTLRGYRDSESIINLLVAMDLTYRSWWQEENKKNNG